MATPFRDWPWPIQALIYLGVAFLIVLLGFWLPFSPVAKVRADLEAAEAQLKPLETEVQNLRVYQQRRVELQSEMEALQKQLATLQTRINVIEDLQKGRTGGQELLTAVANTVARTDGVWLTSLSKS